ncbi:MAG: histidinol-phosphatase [Slackia sp.]|nr:histidinol-phosphatase [Slackia sp.]
MTPLVTMHTHSSFCGHAKDALPTMVEAAVSAGVRFMAATEHFPIPDELDPTGHSSMPADRLEPYCAAVLEQRAAHPDMELLLGCELDWLGSDETRDLSTEDFDRFDIVLGSVHFIDGWLVNSRKSEHRWADADVDAVWRRYIDLWCDAAASSMPFTAMAHPDVVKKFGHRPSFDLSPYYDRMVEAAVAGGRMIEVNTSGAASPCAEMYPAPDLLARFARAGVACTVGTDAHEAAHIARGVHDAYKLMHDAGYRRLAVPGYGREVRFFDL